MLVGIAVGLIIVKWRGGQWYVVDCTGDQCQITQDRQLKESP
jgi:hypothetical protein